MKVHKSLLDMVLPKFPESEINKLIDDMELSAQLDAICDPLGHEDPSQDYNDYLISCN